ncbi:MAG: ATP phosphoribosyltransferase [Cutibacterium avidum]|uniref:ATP phosphoribosyltransferase n=1 Tax=Cutibacterium avidum TaxID=33010 RepID=UPI00083E80AE|nr:ATP phosphoribosyltransferase [Cutibacterium avidum]AOG27206.1 ATP phosphoribosyltransferase [Cutibacterium avidum]MDU1064246.1 ATP phosphoribosyltransferase [Cutibacterium avidum]
MSDLLRVAVPNKGALSEATSSLLTEAGYRQRSDRKDLTLVDEANGVEFFYLRPRDIAVYVGEGTLDIGITGRDLLLDSGADAAEIKGLGFGHSRFRFAAPKSPENTVEGLAGKRIATSYPGLLGSFLTTRGIDAHLIHLDGAVESSIRLGVADAIADVVETGTTLRKAGLEVFGDVILESEAVLIQRRDFTGGTTFDHFIRRIDGVQVARGYVMVDYDVPAEALSAVTELTPGLEAPTVSPLAKNGWYAVRAMVPRGAVQGLMDELWDAGARAILSTELSACRL